METTETEWMSMLRKMVAPAGTEPNPSLVKFIRGVEEFIQNANGDSSPRSSQVVALAVVTWKALHPGEREYIPAD